MVAFTRVLELVRWLGTFATCTEMRQTQMNSSLRLDFPNSAVAHGDDFPVVSVNDCRWQWLSPLNRSSPF